jgi:hypothetical protein
MSKERDEMKVAGIIVAGVAVVLTLVALTNGCDENPDFITPKPAAHVHADGCGHEMPDAGPDADCYLNPLSGLGGCP